MRADPEQVTRPSSPPARPGSRRAGSFRPDVEGLRAIAVGSVLLYHAGILLVPGGFIGVDIFFVLSGFLITGLLVRELETTGRVSLPRFYARRVKRLLPAASLVLVVTSALTWAFGSVVDWRTFGYDIVGAATYVVNWLFAAQSVDYLAEGTGASPVQHFWSLAVEEQYYIVWPLLLIVVALIVRRRQGAHLRPTMAVALAIVVVPSFVASVLWTATSPTEAFFVTPTRLWELGVGAFVAIGTRLWSRIPPAVAALVGWLGLATLATGALLLNAELPWPGAWALVPTLGTAAVIVAGFSLGRGAPAHLLGWAPLVWIGGLSYSLYLWHWPLLIAAENIWGELGQKKGLLVVLLAVIPAWLSLRFVENPARHARSLARSNTLTLSLGLNLTAVGAIAGILLVLAVPRGTSTTEQEVDDLGANAVGSAADQADPPDIEVVDRADSITPDPAAARYDLPPAYADDCQVGVESSAVEPCIIGQPDGSTTLALVGDSKALQWESALDSAGTTHGWRVETMTKSACAFTDAMQTVQDDDYVSCYDFGENVMSYLLDDLRPDAVIVSQGANEAYTRDGNFSVEGMVTGLNSYWTRLEDAGIDVIVLLDNPSPVDIDDVNGQVYGCVAEHPENLSACAFDRARGTSASGSAALSPAAEQTAAVDVVDMADWICGPTTCPAVVGDALVYRQGSHLTDTYVRTLDTALSDRLEPLVTAAR
ncbi:acyltransferase [Paraoerskovia sediminicola]|uniref:Acyltransferase n=1 Tax=Paraoerskovia sediminicola TaxID=1138587 RepID=A0ABN6XDK9_9CELL|nr:acyltransferase family protein [Paraoerskovia sediminicola]BDZ42879.1 acyltransferase [Paraoerskovia sediminicola]